MAVNWTAEDELDIQPAPEVVGRMQIKDTAFGIASATYGAVGRNYTTMSLITLVTSLPSSFFVSVFLILHAATGRPLREVPGVMALFIIFLLVGFLFQVYGYAALLSASIEATFGRKAHFRNSFRRATDEYWGVLLSVVIYRILVPIGLFLCIAPGVAFALWWLQTGIVATAEGQIGWRGMKRSRELGRGRYLKNGAAMLICGIPLLFTFGMQLAVLIIVTDMNLRLYSVVFLEFLKLLLQCLAFPLVATCETMIYNVTTNRDVSSTATSPLYQNIPPSLRNM